MLNVNVHFLIATFLLSVCTILSGTLFNKSKRKKIAWLNCHFNWKANGCVAIFKATPAWLTVLQGRTLSVIPQNVPPSFLGSWLGSAILWESPLCHRWIYGDTLWPLSFVPKPEMLREGDLYNLHYPTISLPLTMSYLASLIFYKRIGKNLVAP